MAEQVVHALFHVIFGLSNLHPFLSVNCLGEDRSCDLLAWDGFPGEEP